MMQNTYQRASLLSTLDLATIAEPHPTFMHWYFKKGRREGGNRDAWCAFSCFVHINEKEGVS